MTVRTWFRLQRAALWARDDGVAAAIDRLTTAAMDGTPLPTYIYIGDGKPAQAQAPQAYAIVFDLQTYISRQRIIDEISAGMERRARYAGRICD